ncbi:type I-C CRISPR-associated protein Cas8c/Csd1 [Tropicimonas sediminicola]|uniref:CRISPR-associated protein, Csd1 family n=1 Tax=Tropicimonas sediminicola TaxID=1031541 RepID=A0A239MBR7_9RHOB|nr:type I-C CRISPR-associated protein Cas8c/Csd1 [Tropicimonas sediminicola]SNT39593.1 CRISPR-associated protein, Csd1 family [Tropicimonas sediminicola]
MSVLASLARAYDRLPDAPAFGYSREKIGFAIVLRHDGSVADVVDLRDMDRKRSPRMLLVPQAVKRTVGIAPNFLWDKTSYVLGLTAGPGKRLAQEQDAFRERHTLALAGTTDPGLLAFLRFLEGWNPEDFAARGCSDELLDLNAVFAVESEYRERFLHERPAARALWNEMSASRSEEAQVCLVSGSAGPVSRLHPSIKGVWGAQSSGASLISFNLDAFTSYGHSQGDNAPVSERAAFAYTTALNEFLKPGSAHRVQIADASTVFWADAEAPLAEAAENVFAALVDSDSVADDEAAATLRLRSRLESIRQGQRLEQVEPDLEGIRFHVLGLAPNAARLSVRFHWEDSFGTLTRNYQRFLSDIAVEPAPRDGFPPLWRYMLELAVLGKRENVPPKLAGEWFRAILTGGTYPLTLLSTTSMRIRADGQINRLRAGILRAVLVRNFRMEVPVALDPEETNRGYLLGRLFAAHEEIQRSALGGNVNATIRDKFYGAASSTPQKVFGLLFNGSVNHLQKLRKQNPGRGVNLEKLVGTITDRMSPGGEPFPASLSPAEQALFGLGYYHQHSEFFRKSETGSAHKEADA